MIDGSGDLDDALGPPVGGLQWDDHVLRGTERRETDQRQPGRAVENDVLVLAADVVQGIGQRQVQVGFLPDSLMGQVVGRQGRAGRDQIDVRKAGLADDRARISVGAGVEQGFDARQRISFCQKAFGDVALGVGIDEDILWLPIRENCRNGFAFCLGSLGTLEPRI